MSSLPVNSPDRWRTRRWASALEVADHTVRVHLEERNGLEAGMDPRHAKKGASSRVSVPGVTMIKANQQERGE